MLAWCPSCGQSFLLTGDEEAAGVCHWTCETCGRPNVSTHASRGLGDNTSGWLTS